MYYEKQKIIYSLLEHSKLNKEEIFTNKSTTKYNLYRLELLTIENLDLSYINLSDYYINNITFNNINLSYSNFSNTTFYDVDFINVNFSKSNLYNTSFGKMKIHNTNFYKSNLYKPIIFGNVENIQKDFLLRALVNGSKFL